VSRGTVAEARCASMLRSAMKRAALCALSNWACGGHVQHTGGSGRCSCVTKWFWLEEKCSMQGRVWVGGSAAACGW
jgi:hypothetical protein